MFGIMHSLPSHSTSVLTNRSYPLHRKLPKAEKENGLVGCAQIQLVYSFEGFVIARLGKCNVAASGTVAKGAEQGYLKKRDTIGHNITFARDDHKELLSLHTKSSQKFDVRNCVTTVKNDV
jgi:hypothetical protein